MAVDVVPPSGSKPAVALRGATSFWHAMLAEMRKVTWPEVAQVRQATIAIIVFVLVLALFIWLLDVALQGILVTLIPSLFAGR